MEASELDSHGLGHRLRNLWYGIHTTGRLCRHQFVCWLGLDSEDCGPTKFSALRRINAAIQSLFLTLTHQFFLLRRHHIQIRTLQEMSYFGR